MRKVIESGDDRTEVTVDTPNSEERVKKSFNLWENLGYFDTESCDFSMEKATCPKILSFISVKPIHLLKIVKKFIIPTFSY